MELDARAQLALQNDLRHAIERHELQLYYQPKIHGKSGQVTGVEALLEDTQETLRAFSQLASAGVSLSIDDFGTGCSSLSYLRKLPARQLKIDLFARQMATRLLTPWAMGETRTAMAAAPELAAGREDFRDSLYLPDEPDTVIDVLQ